MSVFAHKSKLCKYSHIPPFESLFRTLPDRLSLLRNGYLVCYPEVWRSGRGVDHPFKSSVEVKDRVELYLSSPLWAIMACSRANVAFQSRIQCDPTYLVDLRNAGGGGQGEGVWRVIGTFEFRKWFVQCALE